MFWAIISVFSIIVAVLVIWVNASAFGMEERDHKKRQIMKSVSAWDLSLYPKKTVSHPNNGKQRFQAV